jgi:hypothetical protein
MRRQLSGVPFMRFVIRWLRGCGEIAHDVWHRHVFRFHQVSIDATVRACSADPSGVGAALPQQLLDIVG